MKIRMKKFLSCNKVLRSDVSTPYTDVDVREEYANAFRTESYNEFWTRVLALTTRESINCKTTGSTTADRLPSYRVFAEHLLDPDQPTVSRVLASAKNRPKDHSLLSDYFVETADASVLCGLLLKDIDHIRVKYRSLKTTPENHLPIILTRLTEFSNFFNPFVSTASSQHRFRAVQATCTKLLKRLESSRDKVRAKLQLINKLKRSSAIFLVAFTVSLTTIIATHALALLVAAPGLIAVTLELASTRKSVRLSVQLDEAAKGTYILNRDLDTISRLMARVNDELEHMRTMVKFWLERGQDRLQASGEVARQLKKNNSSFRQQLDELEEHLYLCFMTINRARNLVIKEIMDPGKPIGSPNLLSMYK
ncbi:hypothetical protein ACSBR2_008366 [Camellia fascicularis]